MTQRDAVTTIQARADRSLRQKLAADDGVVRALSKLEERTNGFGLLTRRSLLTGALRLKRSICPEVADALAACREMTGYRAPVELYVRPEPVFSAFCSRDPAGLVSIGLSSRMIESFTQAELTFVIGHELGHIIYDHFGLPMPLTAMVEDLAGRIVSRPTAIELFVWCRAAELSADRIGLLCARDVGAVASAFFKLSSGLSAKNIGQDIEALSAQVDSIASTPSARKELHDDDSSLDCFDTHPYNPLRVRALLAFARSQLYRGAAGLGTATGMSDTDLEELVDAELSLMQPSYLEDKSHLSERMRELLLLAGVAVAASSGSIDERELRALMALLGADAIRQPLLDPSGGRERTNALAAEIQSQASLAERTRLVQHLTIVASADGVVTDDETAVMIDVAARLGVPPRIIGETLRASACPMD